MSAPNALLAFQDHADAQAAELRVELDAILTRARELTRDILRIELGKRVLALEPRASEGPTDD